MRAVAELVVADLQAEQPEQLEAQLVIQFGEIDLPHGQCSDQGRVHCRRALRIQGFEGCDQTCPLSAQLGDTGADLADEAFVIVGELECAYLSRAALFDVCNCGFQVLGASFLLGGRRRSLMVGERIQQGLAFLAENSGQEEPVHPVEDCVFAHVDRCRVILGLEVPGRVAAVVRHTVAVLAEHGVLAEGADHVGP